MKKNKHTNIGYFFLEHKKHLETNKQKKTQTKKNPKPNNNNPLYFRYPYFKIATTEDHISDVLIITWIKTTGLAEQNSSVVEAFVS